METGVPEHRKESDDGHSFIRDVAAEDEGAIKNAGMMERAISIHVGKGACSNPPDSDLPGTTIQGAYGDNRSTAGKHRPPKHHANGHDRDTMDVANNVNGRLGSTLRNSFSTSSSENSSSVIRARGHGVPPASLTDDERMNMLRHMRPSVFGVPVRLQTNTARPRSAADAMMSTRPKLAASSGIMLDTDGDTRQLHYRDPCMTHEQSRRKVRKHKGIFAQACWIGDEKSPRLSLTTAGTPSVQINRSRSGSHSCCDNDRGDRSAQSFVNSIAFGVNMGMLETLAGPTTATSTSRVNKRRGQSAPRTRR